MRAIIFKPIVIAVSLATATTRASCSFEHETVVRGRFLRCESSQFYWDASSANLRIQQAYDRALAQTDPQFREEFRRRWREQGALPGSRVPQSDFVAVVYVDWQAYTTAEWDRDAPTAIEIEAKPQEFHETVRYLWRGPSEVCKEAVPGSSIDLWVVHPCCDTEPGGDGCLMHMNYAEPAPRPMADSLSKALNGR